MGLDSLGVGGRGVHRLFRMACLQGEKQMTEQLTLYKSAEQRLYQVRNGIMGVVRVAEFCRDVQDFKAADEVLQQGVAACYAHLTTLQEAQAEVMATGLELRNKEKQENGTGRECSSCGSRDCQHQQCSECNEFHTDCEGCDPQGGAR